MANETSGSEVEVEEVDIEEYGKRGENVPRARVYIIKVDKTTYRVKVHEMKGREILTLAGKIPPEDYKLTEKFHGHHRPPKTIGLDETVHFREHGIERFMTLKKDHTEG
jgi:hypothetical protein